MILDASPRSGAPTGADRPVPGAAVWAARTAGRLSRAAGAGNGRTLPGRVLLRLVPDALSRLAAGYQVVLVSGTNGKTTTTRLLAQAAGRVDAVVSNSDGANLTTGLVSTLMDAPSRHGIAVLEVDEVALETVLSTVEPQLLVLLNLSRDQLDRTTEVRDHVARWSRALSTTDRVTVVANCDDALVVAAVLAARPDGHGVRWVGAGKHYRGDSRLCPSCDAAWEPDAEHWHCSACGLSRPEPSWALVGDDLVTDGVVRPLRMLLPGRANASNAVMAAAAADLLGAPLDDVLVLMRTVEQVQGRYAVLRVDDHEVLLLLAKNPAGWLEALEQLPPAVPVVVTVNARAADGVDVSWLWDVPFERLRGRTVVASGERASDVSVRLAYAEVPHHTEAQPRTALAWLPAGRCAVVGNYTAFVAARAALQQSHRDGGGQR